MDDTLRNLRSQSEANESDARREELFRVLASKTFSKAARLSSFLRHVCEAGIDGDIASLSEHRIGVLVFGRPEHYSPGEDTIVRTTARLLRQRLERYYESEGVAAAIRIVIPRGGYAPVFASSSDTGLRGHMPDGSPAESATITLSEPLLNDSVAASDIPVLQPMAAIPTTVAGIGKRLSALWQRSLRSTALGLSGRRLWLLAGLGLGLTSITSLYATAVDGPHASMYDLLWSAMFAGDRDTLLVPADSGLVMYESATQQEVSLDDYISKRLSNASELMDATRANVSNHEASFYKRRYTGVISVMLAAEMGKLAQAAPKRFHVRFARDVQLGDLKHANAILVGVRQANPWAQLYRDHLNFHIDWDQTSKDFLVLNDRPAAGEKLNYAYRKDDPKKIGFATIAFVRGLNGEGHVLLIGGTSSAGTESATEFLLDPRRMGPILQSAARSDGTIGEFELLLQCVMQADGSTDVQLLGSRVRPA